MTHPDLFTHTTPDTAFDGASYEPKRDYVRLAGYLLKVYRAMSDGAWWSIGALAEAVGCSENTASARIRDLRKPKYGGNAIERKRVVGGLHVYRMKINSAPISVGPQTREASRGLGRARSLP